MDKALPFTQFVAGQEIARFLTSCGILSEAWEEILNASVNNIDSFVWNKHDNVVYVTFPSFCLEDFIVKDSMYGEINIQNKKGVFSKCFNGSDDQPTFVYKGALTRFLHILDNSDFIAQVEMFTNLEGEQAILFVGHSIGGVVATLATLWFLEKRLTQISPFCITFGSPLVGDGRLVEAIDREGWTCKFCHVVSKHDIVPRMLFAPFESIIKPLGAVLPYWWSTMGNASTAALLHSIQNACKTFYQNVLLYTSTIANESQKEFDLSPYRPFGTYMFCSSYGVACMEDPEAVLKMLYFTLQNTQGKSLDEIASVCISEHTGYGDMLDDITKCILGTRKMETPLPDSLEMGVSVQLEAMNVGAIP